MTNDISSLMPQIVGRGLLSLREKAIMPRLVNASLGAEAAQKGDHIKIPIASPAHVTDVNPSQHMPNPPDTIADYVSVPLDHWKKASFYLTDQEMEQIDASENFLPLQMQEAINALAGAINETVLEAAAFSPNCVGSIFETPFAPEPDSDPQDYHGVRAAIEARKILNAHHAPKMGRFGVLNYDAEANALGLPQFANLGQSGSHSVAIEGEVGRKFGIDWYSAADLPKSKRLPAAVYPSRSYNSGANYVQMNTGRELVHAGMHIYFGSNSEARYKITNIIRDVSANTDRVFIEPDLANSINSSTRVHAVEHITYNFVMHRDAIALVMRPLQSSGMMQSSAGQMMSIADPQTGLSLRLEVIRQHKQTVWELDVLWGVALVRPEWCVKILA